MFPLKDVYFNKIVQFHHAGIENNHLKGVFTRIRNDESLLLIQLTCAGPCCLFLGGNGGGLFWFVDSTSQQLPMSCCSVSKYIIFIS